MSISAHDDNPMTNGYDPVLDDVIEEDGFLQVSRDVTDDRRILMRRHHRLLRGGKIISDSVRQDEIAVCQALHQRARAETIRTVIGEVCFAHDE